MRCFVLLLIAATAVIAEDSSRLRVIVIGDWGQELTSSSRPTQELVARSMGTYLEDNPDIAFIVSTGDNFYCCGVTSPVSERFENTWYDVYLTDEYPVMKSKRWYISVGNHDHSSNFDELNQVLFGALEDQWYFPDLWYDFVERVGDFSVHFVVIDTQALRRNKHNPSEQRAYLERTLRDSTADYVVVVGHHPAINAGYHGGSSTVRSQVQSVMVRYNADIYITGHDHNLQHIRPRDVDTSSSYIDYIISGGGGRRLYGISNSNLNDLINRGFELKHFEEDFGFVVLDFDSNGMGIDYISPSGNSGYQSVYGFSRPNYRRSLME